EGGGGWGGGGGRVATWGGGAARRRDAPCFGQRALQAHDGRCERALVDVELGFELVGQDGLATQPQLLRLDTGLAIGVARRGELTPAAVQVAERETDLHFADRVFG